MTLGEKLSKLRKEYNYTQEQLADILSVTRQSISKWESDIAYPETDKLIKIGKLFECSMQTSRLGSTSQKVSLNSLYNKSNPRSEIERGLCHFNVAEYNRLNHKL